MNERPRILPTYTAEEKREIDARWMAMWWSRLRKEQEKYEHLKRQFLELCERAGFTPTEPPP